MADRGAAWRTSPRTSGPTASRLRVTGAVLAAGLLLAGCGTKAASSPPSQASPPVLRIGAGVEAAGGAAAPDGGPTLAGALPSSPADAAVYRYQGGVEEATVRRLAAALGLTGAAVRETHGWVVRSGDAELAVRDDGTGAWAYVRDATQCRPGIDPAAPADPDTAVGCAAAPPPGSPRLGPDATAARAAAAPVLAAAGLAGVEPRVSVSSPQTYVTVDPAIDGSATTGIATMVAVTRSGIASAGGVLAAPVRGQQYPLVSAKAAFAEWATLPRPEIAIACPDHVDGAPLTGLCARPVVTGAALGLTLRSDAGDPVLVPAWLFTVRGSDTPITMVAVAPGFLASDEGAHQDDSGGGSGQLPPSQVPPAGGSAPGSSDAG